MTQGIDAGGSRSDGPFVQRLEREFAARVGRGYGVAVGHGSVALEVAIATIGIGPTDEVILPTFTTVSPLAAIVRAGAIPVVIDSDPHTWNMDVSQIEAKITSKTKAILVVHTYGLPVDMAPVLKLAEQYNLRIIEDVAELYGQTYNGRPCGSFGDISTVRFYPNKYLVTGSGGMIVTDDVALAERCREVRTRFFESEPNFVRGEFSLNGRMSNLQAALGIAQLERLEEFIDRKRRMGRLYTELLADVPGLQLPVPATDYADNLYWVYGLVLRDEIPFDAREMMKRLAERGIETRSFFWPIHEQPVFPKTSLSTGESLPVAENLSRRGFYVPNGIALTDEQIDRVATAIKRSINP